jgi:hypothetical protein
MRKAKALRIAGFVGALCASAALVGTSVAGTGAYFTDSHDGTIASNSGHLTLDNVGETNLDFANLMPGEDQSANIPYTVNVSSGKVDVWMVFDPSSAGYGHFTGSKDVAYGPDNYTGGGMGRYGHFQVGANGAVAFRSHNLQMAKSPTPNCADGTVPGADGRGGSDVTGPDNQECGVPPAIRLASNLSNTATGNVNIVFGLSGKQTQQDQTEWTVGYKIVATQAGHAPNDPNLP